MNDPVLCYVKEPWAWFTTASLDQQWGDDWNDAPYQHNAGDPYEWRDYMAERGVKPYALVKITYEGPFETPGSWDSRPYISVEEINHRAAPWLFSPRYGPNHGTAIHSGTPPSEFIRLVEQAGGRVWVPLDMAFADAVRRERSGEGAANER